MQISPERLSGLTRRISPLLFTLVVSTVVSARQGAQSTTAPDLFKSFSKKQVVSSRTGSGQQPWRILHQASRDTQSVHIRALRVEFVPDSSTLTTGNGTFIFANDIKELGWYHDRTYRYDNLPHDKAYFSHQLQFVRDYYRTVSRGRLKLTFDIFPRDDRSIGYKVPEKMTKYSPGAKKSDETYNEYYMRRTRGLMQFVADAIKSANAPSEGSFGSPFADIRIDSTSHAGTYHFIDTAGTRVIFLLIHAGASYLTDGGTQYAGQNTPSDMIDAFISTDFFEYYSDTIETIDRVRPGKRAGVWVSGESNNQILIDEIMMVSATSNQDSLNWGIHGILVNQVARQLGIPDLYSTMSGVSGVGAFCIMDFAGYSAGRGFIPPWPSAWVRAFMGWDQPVVAHPGATPSTFRIKAIGNQVSETDTTILLVPINDHEYYLIENRQRNPQARRERFLFDTTDNVEHLSALNHVNLEANVISTLGEHSAIDSVHHFDVGLSASGVIVWHIDEEMIHERLTYNVVNADSQYRAVNLVEADGINDLGITFRDAFYQAAFDYGGAEDIFPHRTHKKPLSAGKSQLRADTTINSFGPFTRPATKSNDGGHTYLNLAFSPASSPSATECVRVRDYYVFNFVDSLFSVTIGRDPQVRVAPGWRRRIVAANAFDPVSCNLVSGSDSKELVVLDQTGRLYIFSATGEPYGNRTYSISAMTLSGDTSRTIDKSVVLDTIRFVDSLPPPVSFATILDDDVYIPCQDSTIRVLRSVSTNPSAVQWDTLRLSSVPTSYVCGYRQDAWAVGLRNGSIQFGNQFAPGTLVSPAAAQQGVAVSALALIDSVNGTLAVMHDNGMLSIISQSGFLRSAELQGEHYPPFSIVTADLDHRDTDTTMNIIITDSRQGVWNYRAGPLIEPASDWSSKPLDWAGAYYSFREDTSDTSRQKLSANGASPALADIDGDGMLDILVPGTNGVFAFNAHGANLTSWPALLDTRYWYQRGTVRTPVTVATTQQNTPLVLFSAPTGENVTFTVARLDTTIPEKGKIIYERLTLQGDTIIDSITGLTTSFIDSLILFGDSLVLPYVIPGGYVDALNPQGQRPGFIVQLANVGQERQSYWPLTTGSMPQSAPVLCDLDNNQKTDIVTVTRNGWVYRWETGPDVLTSNPIWPQVGATSARTFNYSGPAPVVPATAVSSIKEFYNFPNPVRGLTSTIIRYDLSAPASNVVLSIYTMTGYKVFEQSNLPGQFGRHEFNLSLQKFGPAVYRCRLEAVFKDGTKKSQLWKMAVINK